MGNKEKEIMKERLLGLSQNECLFRINAGMAWAAQKKDTFRPHKKTVVTVNLGDLVLRRARPFHGAPAGWPDLCGWTEIEITPEMVGQKIAVFTGEEIKATGSKKLIDRQKFFQDLILRMGGFFRVLSCK